MVEVGWVISNDVEVAAQCRLESCGGYAQAGRDGGRPHGPTPRGSQPDDSPGRDARTAEQGEIIGGQEAGEGDGDDVCVNVWWCAVGWGDKAGGNVTG